MYFWDWKTGYNFQRLQTIPQPGSIDPEMGIYAMAFDQSGSRLITCEADKTIKIYKEDETAVNLIENTNKIFYLCSVFFSSRLNKVILLIGHPIYSNENDIKSFFVVVCFFLFVCIVS